MSRKFRKNQYLSLHYIAVHDVKEANSKDRLIKTQQNGRHLEKDHRQQEQMLLFVN